MNTYFCIAQIIVSASLVAVIVLQAQSSGLGGIFGGGGGVHTGRRGVERLLFNVTIGLSIAFFVLSLLNVAMAR
ncbi:MAG: preprotein translocase subunit SecG [Chloroflexota bacterium]|nr:preprotein translocase subunit SecG [Chloroflexota bacterium]